MSFTDDLFKAQAAVGVLEDKFCQHACEVLGVDHANPESWPFSDYHFDSYDASFELDGCTDALRLTPEQREKFWALGFRRCWLNDQNGNERHYCWCGDACPESQGRLKCKSELETPHV